MRNDRQEIYVAYQITHGRRPDGWWFTVEIPGRPREEHGPYSTEDVMLDDKVARMEELEVGIVEPWTIPTQQPRQVRRGCSLLGLLEAEVLPHRLEDLLAVRVHRAEDPPDFRGVLLRGTRWSNCSATAASCLLTGPRASR